MFFYVMLSFKALLKWRSEKRKKRVMVLVLDIQINYIIKSRRVCGIKISNICLPFLQPKTDGEDVYTSRILVIIS